MSIQSSQPSHLATYKARPKFKVLKKKDAKLPEIELKIRSVESVHFDEMNRVEQSTPATSPVTAVKEESVKKSRIYTIDEILGRSSSNQTGKFQFDVVRRC